MLEKTNQALLVEAAGTGEVLTVIYSGGRAPGTKRKIVVRSVDDDEMGVREFPSETFKTYLVSRTMVVDQDNPAPWMPEDAGKAVAVDPKSYFSGWAYSIPPHFYSALGVNSRYVIDQEKTKPAREMAIAQGMDKKEATKRIKIMRREDAVSSPPAYDFHEGDLFYREGLGGDWLQVLKMKMVDGLLLIEVHLPIVKGAERERLAYRVTQDELAHVLKTGLPLPDGRRISASQSDTDALRMQVQQASMS